MKASQTYPSLCLFDPIHEQISYFVQLFTEGLIDPVAAHREKIQNATDEEITEGYGNVPGDSAKEKRAYMLNLCYDPNYRMTTAMLVATVGLIFSIETTVRLNAHTLPNSFLEGVLYRKFHILLPPQRLLER